MGDRDPVSVLLPTVEWNVVCDQLAAQLGPDDELLVICDSEQDPVATRETPDGVEVCVAGAPEGCSGKANALAHGMTRATHDRFVWTDADYERGSDWLDRLVDAGEANGPASAIPFFSGGGWWRLVEPWFAGLFTAMLYFQVGELEDFAWGGGVTFTRSELTVPVGTLVAELRGVLSDDYLLSQRLPTVHPVRSMVTHVEVPGDFRSVRHRIVRFVRTFGVNGTWLPGVVTSTSLVAVGVLFPLGTAAVVTVGFAAIYTRLCLDRANYLWAFPGLLVLPVVFWSAILIDEFEWGGRRYRFEDPGVVEVLGPSDGNRSE